MSEDPINNKNVSQQDVDDTADSSEIILDETGDTMKPGPRGMANKNKQIEMDKESIESNDK